MWSKKTITKNYLDEVTYEIIGSCIEVQKIVGRGLTEKIYHQCLKEEFSLRNIHYLTEMIIPVHYKGKKMEVDFRCDFYVEDCIVVELKAVQEMTHQFQAQLITYMKLLEAPKGVLVNFCSSNIFKEGQKTFVNEYYSHLPMH